jgi:DNA-binding winged helix-turn-helix (wHTH) protein
MSGSVRRFAGFEYSPQTGLRRDGVQIHLGPQARQLLELLLESKGGVVSKAEIAARLWPDRPPSDDSIDRCAYLLRKPLREAGFGDLIATAYGRGLSLRAPVEMSEAEAGAVGASQVGGHILDLWQTAYELAGKRTRDAYERAESAIAAVRERDGHAPAIWSLSADMAAGRVIRGHLDPAQASAMIESAAGRALELAPDHSAALAVLGWSRATLTGQLEDGLGMMARAIAGDPQYGKARAYRTWGFAQLDRLTEAIEEVETGLRYAPHDQALLGLRAWLELCVGNVADAGNHARAGLRLRPDASWLSVVAAISASLDGRHDEAEAAVTHGLHYVPGDPPLLSARAYVAAAAGRLSEAEIALAAAKGGMSGAPRLFIAAALLAMGRLDDASRTLAYARREGCPWFVFAPHDPRLAALRPEIERLRALAWSQPFPD